MHLPSKISQGTNKSSSETNGRSEASLECAVVIPGHNELGHPSIPFERVYDDVIQPACELAGLFALRVSSTSPVDHHTLKRFIEAPIALCALGSTSPQTHFLLGARLGAGKPSIMLVEAGCPHHYEIPMVTAIEYRSELRYREVVEDQQALAAALLDLRSSALLDSAPDDSARHDGQEEPQDDTLDTKQMLQLIHYQLAVLQAEMQTVLQPQAPGNRESTPAEPAASAPVIEGPALEQGEQSYLHARKLYANGASHKEIFQSLKTARNKLIDALRGSTESTTALRIHELLRKTTEFEKYLLG